MKFNFKCLHKSQTTCNTTFSWVGLSLTLGLINTWAIVGPEHRTLRPLAMGNAFVAIVDDKDAMHYNPAGLNLIGRLGNKAKRPDMGHYPLNYFDMHMNFLGAGVPLNEGLDILDFYNNHSSAFSNFKSYQNDSTFNNDLSTFDRKPIRFSGNSGGELAMHNFGMAYYFDAEAAPFADIGVLLPQAGWQYIRADLVGEIAGATSFMDDKLAVGLEYRMAKRQEVEQTQLALANIPAVQELAKEKIDAQIETIKDVSTIGHGFDLGMLWQYDRSIRFGGAIQNMFMILNHEWVVPELTVGVAYSPVKFQNNGSWKRKINFAFDLEDLFNAEKNYKPLNKVNFGAEWEQTLIPWILKGRLAVGVKGGYPTAGLGGNLFTVFSYEFATWAEEEGYYTGQEENRYYVMKFGIGL